MFFLGVGRVGRGAKGKLGMEMAKFFIFFERELYGGTNYILPQSPKFSVQTGKNKWN